MVGSNLWMKERDGSWTLDHGKLSARLKALELYFKRLFLMVQSIGTFFFLVTN